MNENPSRCGPLLRRWRELRHLTQLDLALDANVSARHISFIETGKNVPSRAMLYALSEVLNVPLRERNVLFLAAGYAPPYRETALDDTSMTSVRQALELILRRHEPYSAFACDRYWNLVMTNAAHVAFLRHTLGSRAATLEPYTVLAAPRLNILHLVFAPDGVRPFIGNWEQVAKTMLEQVQRVAAWSHDHTLHALIEALFSYPGVPRRWRVPDIDAPRAMILPCELVNLGVDRTARMFTTVTMLTGPQDITLQDLHIEAFYPADAETAALVYPWA